MQLNGWTHAILDPQTGAPIGVVKDIDDVEDFGPMGTSLLFASDGPPIPQYNWLRGYETLPMDQLDPSVRLEIAGMLTYVLAV